jgi:hypothetical protein
VLASSINFQIKFEPVAFLDGGKTRAFNRTDVHESVFLAIIAGDEAEAFHRVEELYRANGLVTRQFALRCCAFWRGDDIADNLQIRSRNLAAAIHQIELQFLPFGQRGQPGAFNLADVNEHVLTTFIALDKAETLGSVEELHFALARANNLCRHPATAATWAARCAIAATRAATGKTAAACAATAVTVSTAAAAAEAITATAARETITVCGRRAAAEWIERFFPETVPLVAPPAATTSIVTHVFD